MPEDGTAHRLFIAVPLTVDLTSGLVAHLNSHIEAMPGSAVPPSNWHLTIRFLGKVDGPGLDGVVAALDGAELGPGFRLGFGGLGAFPRPARANVLWLAVRDGSDELTSLASAVEVALVNAGWMPEERPFHAHLTLSRIRPAADVRTLVETTPPFPLRLDVSEVVLYESHLGGARKAVYEARERFPLEKRKTKSE